MDTSPPVAHVPYAHLLPLLQCPDCRKAALTAQGTFLVCGACGARYPCRGTIPILLRSDNQVFPISAYVLPEVTAAPVAPPSAPPARVGLGERLRQRIPSASHNLSYERCLRRFAAELPPESPARVLCVGSGNQRVWLEPLLRSMRPDITFVHTDIDASASVDLFCDAHDLPFRDAVFQGVICMAVLEHVLHPESAVGEMHRVLTDNAVIYTEIPFMQQVHEGAYDFTRYTHAGHRRLMRDFVELESGANAGPGTALLWAIEHFALSFVRSAPQRLRTKAVVRLIFGRLKGWDYRFADNPQFYDGASGTFFLGRKQTGYRRSDADIIASYQGAGTLRHH